MSARIQIWGLEIAQWLSALAALPEEQSSAPAPVSDSSFRGSNTAGFRAPVFTLPPPPLHIILFFNGICSLNKEVEDVLRFAHSEPDIHSSSSWEFAEMPHVPGSTICALFPKPGTQPRTLHTELPF